VRVREPSLSKHLCGKVRPGHFNGVCTVVTKLFNATMADVAIFGQKDAQQVAVIRRMVRDLNAPIRIVASPIVREADGLAMSSRNTRLSPAERRNALGLSRGLRKAVEAYKGGETSADAIRALMKAEMEAAGLRVDYASAVDGETLEDVAVLKPGVLLAVAAYSGATRLIDNAVLS
jgi:pantoate--beta-alanine ligase